MLFINGFKKLNQNYFSFREKSEITKLTKLSVFLIVILDIFIYILISAGISFQTKVLNNPQIKYPYQCTKIINQPEKILVLDDRLYRYNYYKKSNVKNSRAISGIISQEMDPRCSEIASLFEKLKKDKEIIALQANQNLLKTKEKKLNNDLRYIQKNYNTVLFEKIASQKDSDSIVGMDLNTKNAKIKYDKLQSELAELKSAMETNEKLFKENLLVNQVHSYVQKNAKNILNSKEEEQKAYNLKKHFISILFVLPFLLFFYFRMNKHNKENKYNKYIINKNLFIVSAIPFISSAAMLFYNLIPHVFLEMFIAFFYSIKTPFVVFYILAAIIIFLITFSVIKIQNREHEKEQQKRSSKIDFFKAYNLSKCQNCKNSVDYLHMSFCPFCNNELKDICTNCGELKLKNGKFCEHCGVENHSK